MKNLVGLSILCAIVCVVYSKSETCRTRYSSRVLDKCMFYHMNIRPIGYNTCYKQRARPIIINNAAEAEAFLQFADSKLRSYMKRPRGYWLAYSRGDFWLTPGHGKVKIQPETPFAEPPGKEKQCNMLIVKTGLIVKERCMARVPIYCEELPPKGKPKGDKTKINDDESTKDVNNGTDDEVEEVNDDDDVGDTAEDVNAGNIDDVDDDKDDVTGIDDNVENVDDDKDDYGGAEDVYDGESTNNDDVEDVGNGIDDGNDEGVDGIDVLNEDDATNDDYDEDISDVGNATDTTDVDRSDVPSKAYSGGVKNVYAVARPSNTTDRDVGTGTVTDEENGPTFGGNVYNSEGHENMMKDDGDNTFDDENSPSLDGNYEEPGDLAGVPIINESNVKMPDVSNSDTSIDINNDNTTTDDNSSNDDESNPDATEASEECCSCCRNYRKARRKRSLKPWM
ncbi:hypothetical protein ACF0H5_006931 [Mactra antiquata]